MQQIQTAQVCAIKEDDDNSVLGQLKAVILWFTLVHRTPLVFGVFLIIC